jgi:hypothetical protein
MFPLPPRLAVFAVSVFPTMALPVMLTLPVSGGQATVFVEALVTLPVFCERVTVTVIPEPASALTRV